MAILEDEAVVVGDGSGDYLRKVARVLQDRLRDAIAGIGDGFDIALTKVLEIAGEELGIEREDHAERETTVMDNNMNTKRRKNSREEATGSKLAKEQLICRHYCPDHKELINPDLWGTLPRELLLLVFAHLPVGEISHLQLLSKEWKQTLATTHSDFNRVCDEVNLNKLCLITNFDDNLFWVRVLDLKWMKWHTYIIVAGCPANLDWAPDSNNLLPRMAAKSEDGGLVCFVTRVNSDSKRKKTRPCVYINVVNPLVRVSRELPPLFDVRSTEMVDIMVDRRTKAFKVFALANRVRWMKVGAEKPSWVSSGLVSQVYDSISDEWTTTHVEWSDLIFDRAGSVAYDFTDGGRLLHLDVDSDVDGDDESRCVSCGGYKDYLFMLQRGSNGPANDESLANQSPTYYIDEFRAQKRGTTWVKINTHRCDPFEHYPAAPYSFSMHACKGFLMVHHKLSIFQAHRQPRKKLTWLYDLSTRKWSVLHLPQLPAGRRKYSEMSDETFTVELPGGKKLTTNHDNTNYIDLMFQPRWAT